MILAILCLPEASLANDVTNRDKDTLVVRVAQNVPAGFEDVDDTIETVFDIYLAGRRIGTAPVRVASNVAVFVDPERLLEILPSRIDREKIAALIAGPLPSNEALRCLPGRTADCGVLPPGKTGIIVNPERFSLELFLTPDFYSAAEEGDAYLGDPISGPSLIQTALVSVSSGNNSVAGVRFGASLDTIASVGRTSFVGQTFVRDSGVNIQRAYVQHFWRKRAASAGLLQQSNALTFSSYRLVGGEYGSFFGARLDQTEGLQTPLEIVLPRAAQVEVYRDNLLIHATRLESGLQSINTANFPSGSYSVRILAKDGDVVLLDETRVFTRTADLPPPGEWSYKLRGGLRVRDIRSNVGTNLVDQPFFPSISNDALFSASVGRRIGPATAIGGEILNVGNKVYGEASIITYQGNIRGLAAVAIGTDGAYSMLANATTRIGIFDLSLAGRHTRLADDRIGPIDDRFRPFYRSEDTVLGSVGFAALGGNFSVNGSYSRSPGFDNRYIVSTRYTRSVDVGSFGEARLTAFALKSESETRVGLSIAFLKRISRKTLASYSAGAEYRSVDANSGSPDGIFPLADARLSRQDRFGTVDLNSQVGVSTDAVRTRAFVATNARSNLGTLDAVVDYENRRGGGAESYGLSANLFTGIVIGGGEFKLGIRDPGGDAALLVKVDDTEVKGLAKGDDVGQYRIILGNQYAGAVKPGGTTAFMATSFREYRVGLKPEGSPPYSVDLSLRQIPLYPGNVAVIEYKAFRVVTVLGRLLDTAGSPISGARISGPSDTTRTDENGYFIISAMLDDFVDFYTADNIQCAHRPIAELLSDHPADGRTDYVNIGNQTCGLKP